MRATLPVGSRHTSPPPRSTTRPGRRHAGRGQSISWPDASRPLGRHETGLSGVGTCIFHWPFCIQTKVVLFPNQKRSTKQEEKTARPTNQIPQTRYSRPLPVQDCLSLLCSAIPHTSRHNRIPHTTTYFPSLWGACNERGIYVWSSNAVPRLLSWNRGPVDHHAFSPSPGSRNLVSAYAGLDRGDSPSSRSL